jgi:hypothetical protein
VSEPRRGRRKWSGRARQREAVYGNRRRIKGKRGKRLMRLRSERVERSFAHCYETGGMRRVHLKGRENILKRLLIHVGGFNLSLAMRNKLGAGTPRGLAAKKKRFERSETGSGRAWGGCSRRYRRFPDGGRPGESRFSRRAVAPLVRPGCLKKRPSATGC